MSQQSSTPTYELLYWPTIPGRGEYIRLILEATQTPYTDIGNASSTGGKEVMAALSSDKTHDEHGNPPAFAPPMLRIKNAGPNGAPLLIYQTPSILSYLGGKLGVAGDGSDAEKHWVLSHALTALDLSNEAHDTHHPVAVMQYYEDQKEEALKKSKDFRESRITKFFGFFERVLKGNEEKGKGKYLVGDKLSYADTTLWQVVDGLKFAFPKELAARETDFPLLMGTFYPALKDMDSIKAYLGSDRRLQYSNGLFRHYPELDRQ
ncbi:glutathione S-transferase [Sporormia fimetaria CBS 119925]|uniref:Glutathione S-transferase n=1 Tax=Sporormia fimetaria CBS 119925 TaxID=1340428 RepID=A0A6A6V4J8_9PLEO|nr:glutathione S-transferase [Sporormia fimetaria CBS 119925]